MATPDRLQQPIPELSSSGGENISQRIYDYLPPADILAIKPTPLDLKKRDAYLKGRPGADYTLVAYEGKMIMVPAWHPLNSEPQIAHANQYGTGMFEGGSVEPVVNDQGDIVGANAILMKPRMDRLFNWSLPGRPGITSPVDRSIFEQGILDYAAVLGKKALRTPDGKVARAYLRPSIAPGEGPLGIGIKGQKINMAVELWAWPSYFSDEDRVYNGSGLILAAGPNQRLSQLYGKHASNYGDASRVGNLARAMGVDEALYSGPYRVNLDGSRGAREVILDTYRRGRTPDIAQPLKRLVLADGPGEEIMAITKDGQLWLPPMDVNRLGGTTANYIMKYLAPKLGLKAKEHRFTLEDIATETNQKGKIQALFYTGNAAKIAPIGEIQLKGFNGEPLDTYQLQIPDVLRALVERYDQEVRGKVPPSDSSLLTPIDLAGGEQARAILDTLYAEWFT